jgi:hypothetical protein
VCREHLSTNTAPVISSKHELANPTSSHDHVSVEVDIWSITAVNAVRREHLSTNTAPIISSKHELANPTSSHDHISVAKLWPWKLKLVYLHHYKLSHPGRIGCFSTYTK